MPTIDLPPEFDPVFYGKIKPYLPPNADVLRNEFELYGKKSGAPGSFLCYRENIVNLCKQAGPILEIGPGHRPDFTGGNVKYIDLVRREELEKLYPELSDKNGGTPEIHYLASDLADGKITEKFNLVYSAHNIEHQPNPVAHINSVAKVLNPGGFFVMVIPDRNYTFDYYRPNSSLIDILAASGSQTLHSARTIMSSRQTTHNDCFRHWLGDHGESRLSDDWIIDRFRDWSTTGTETRSQHAHTFDPDSFAGIFRALSERGIIELELLRVYNTPYMRNEFIAIFRRKEAKPTTFDGRKGMLGAQYVDLDNHPNPDKDYVFSEFRKDLAFEFEVPLTTHCNLNCQCCTVFSPVAEKSFLSLDSFFRDLKRMVELFGMDNVWFRMVGGEPLLHPDINQMMLLARKLLPNALISITTNGLLLDRMQEDFFRIAKDKNIVHLISPYPPVPADKIIASLKQQGIPAFRTVNKFNTRKMALDIDGKQDPAKNFERCGYRCNFVLDGKLSRCFYPLTISHFNKKFGTNLEVLPQNYIDIHQHTPEEIREFLQKSIPFCRFCKNDHIEYLDWQTSSKKIEEWI